MGCFDWVHKLPIKARDARVPQQYLHRTMLVRD